MFFTFLLCFIFSFHSQAQTYNSLWIPDTLSGKNFNLVIKDTFKQVFTGNQTITGAINNDNFWGPTIIMNKGDIVNFNVTNKLNDTTTLHWHGMHLPAVMDGGPHQTIPPNTVWKPYWKVDNPASTLWYHPHLHEMTLQHLTKGIGGFIIIRDSIESKLPLPRTYGVDDIPIALTSRRYGTNNQMTVQNTNYGDYMLTNGIRDAQISLPKQFVRLRILNVEIERGYNLGFSDNRPFYVVANDGALLEQPVAVTRLKLMVGERVEILVDLSNDAIGSSLDLKSYNSGQIFGYPGGEPATSGAFGSLLNNIDFNVLHINVAAATANGIRTLPTTLISNSYWTSADVTNSRTISVTAGTPGTPFSFDNALFKLNVINQTINLNAVEKWTIVNNRVFGHSFHIHDIQFKIIERNGSASNVQSYEKGWKDVMYVPINETVSFIAKFNDYADPVYPYMYHCHFSDHEDGGMMGQFVVKSTTGTKDLEKKQIDFNISPNPASQRLFIELADATNEVYYITIFDMLGRTKMMLPKPNVKIGIDISTLAAGQYVVQLMDTKTKSISIQKFIKQ